MFECGYLGLGLVGIWELAVGSRGKQQPNAGIVLSALLLLRLLLLLLLLQLLQLLLLLNLQQFSLFLGHYFPRFFSEVHNHSLRRRRYRGLDCTCCGWKRGILDNH